MIGKAVLLEWLKSLKRIVGTVLYIHAFSVRLLVYVRAMDKMKQTENTTTRENQKKKNKQTKPTISQIAFYEYQS